MTRRRTHDVLALLAWVAFLAAAVAGLHALGDGPLAAPPWPGLGRWLDDRGAATAAFALVRLGLVAVAWYLLGTTIVATALRIVRADHAAHAVERVAPAPVRRLVRAATGLSLAASLVSGSVAAAASSDADEPVVMRRLPPTTAQPATEEPVTMTRLPDDQHAPPPTPAPAAHVTWEVERGQHLWSIARQALREAWHRTPTDPEIDPYWRRLIEENRHRLPDSSNPDLIVPGLRLQLPERPPEPAR